MALGHLGVVDMAFEATTSNLGQLEGLPVEIQLKIFNALDIRSALKFKLVNRKAREIITATREYRLAITHGFGALTVIVRLNLVDTLGFADILHALETRSCAFNCGRTGSHLFLPTLSKICFPCLEERKELTVVALQAPTRATSDVLLDSHRFRAISGVPGGHFDFGAHVLTQELTPGGHNVLGLLELTKNLNKPRSPFLVPAPFCHVWIGLPSQAPQSVTQLANSFNLGEPVERLWQSLLRPTVALLLPHVNCDGEPDLGLLC